MINGKDTKIIKIKPMFLKLLQNDITEQYLSYYAKLKHNPVIKKNVPSKYIINLKNITQQTLEYIKHPAKEEGIICPLNKDYILVKKCFILNDTIYDIDALYNWFVKKGNIIDPISFETTIIAYINQIKDIVEKTVVIDDSRSTIDIIPQTTTQLKNKTSIRGRITNLFTSNREMQPRSTYPVFTPNPDSFRDPPKMPSMTSFTSSISPTSRMSSNRLLATDSFRGKLEEVGRLASATGYT